MSLGLQRGTVKLVSYQPEWADLFLKEKADFINKTLKLAYDRF